MRKVKIAIGVFILVAAIVATLVYNRSKIKATTSNNIKDVSYVSVDTVKKATPTTDVSFIGTVAANNDVNVVSEAQGKIVANYMTVGEYKSAGSVLVVIDDELKRAALMSAEANLEKSKKDYERMQTLYGQKSVTESQLDGAKLAYTSAEAQVIIARRQLNDTKITAPVGGIITSKNVDLGSYLQNATIVCNMVDISKLKVKVNVAENDVFKLKTGDRVDVLTDVYKGTTLSGSISAISAKGDDSHTYPVEVSIMNDSQHPLKAGMFARINFSSLKKDNVLLIPRASLTGSVKEAKVFVIKNGVSVEKQVVLGSEFGTSVEVLSGLQEGEVIVVGGQNNLVDGSKIEIVTQK